MKFTTSTKPLKTALGLAVVGKNVDRNIQKSTVVQLTADDKTLRINTEAASIRTEVTLYGTGAGESTSIIVDAVMLKNLISTIDAQQIDLDFENPNYVSVVSGTSYFKIPKILDAAEVSLHRPMGVAGEGADVNKADWQFITAHQSFALPTNTTAFPQYNNVWVSENGDVLTGDMVSQVFTHSQKSNLKDTYLLTESIINLLCSVPDGSKISKGDDDSYSISYGSDSIQYLAEFAPKRENDANGFYRSTEILQFFSVGNAPYVEVGVSEISKVLGQLKIVSGKDTKVAMELSADKITFTGNSIKADVPATGNLTDTFGGNVRIDFLSNIVSALPESSVKISKGTNAKSGNCVGLIFSSGDLTVVLSWCR